MANVNISGDPLGPDAEFTSSMGKPIDNANEGAFKNKSFNGIRPEPFDLDRYYDTAYRRAIRAADQSAFGQIAGIGDEMLSHHGLGLGSDAWMSAISKLNANKKDAYEEAADKALTQTVVAQQQKFNQDVAAGKMNLETFVQATSENLKRMGVLVDGSKMAEAMDAAKRGDYIKLEEIAQEWANEIATIMENAENRKAGITARELENKRGERASRNRGIASMLTSTVMGLAKIFFPALNVVPGG
jgi:hypothetical protein